MNTRSQQVKNAVKIFQPLLAILTASLRLPDARLTDTSFFNISLYIKS
jgi:hypothetical protein